MVLKFMLYYSLSWRLLRVMFLIVVVKILTWSWNWSIHYFCQFRAQDRIPFMIHDISVHQWSCSSQIRNSLLIRFCNQDCRDGSLGANLFLATDFGIWFGRSGSSNWNGIIFFAMAAALVTRTLLFLLVPLMNSRALVFTNSHVPISLRLLQLQIMSRPQFSLQLVGNSGRGFRLVLGVLE